MRHEPILSALTQPYGERVAEELVLSLSIDEVDGGMSEEHQRCRALVAEILNQAFLDYKNASGSPYSYKKKLRDYFESEDRHLGSYLWCCEVLDICPAAGMKAINRFDERMKMLKLRRYPTLRHYAPEF